MTEHTQSVPVAHQAQYLGRLLQSGIPD
jgi:hypothetical protein